MPEINSYAVVDRYIDVGQRRLTDSNLVYVAGRTNEAYVRDKVIYRARLRLSDNTAFAVPAGATFYWCIDNSFTDPHTDLVSSQDADFRIPADWADLSDAEGRICWRANLNTTALKAALGSSEDSGTTMREELWMLLPGADPSLIYQARITIKNVVGDITSTPVTPGVTYATQDELRAIAPSGWSLERDGDEVVVKIDGVPVHRFAKPS